MLENSNNNFLLIAGPCVIESEEITRDIAKKIHLITSDLNIPFIFKASYKKANRSKIDSFTGIGDIKGLEILKKISQDFNIPVITDVHSEKEVDIAAKYIDMLQIPAFLCRQTELLVAAAKTNKPINIKKGQFLSAESMRYVIEKITKYGNQSIMLTERGTMFGYQDMVVDFRNIPKMKSFGHSTILDVTHSLQKPNQKEGVTGGDPEMIETIAKAGIASGVDGIFLETHQNPSNAKSDGANMLKLDKLESLLRKLLRIKEAIL